MLRTLLRSRVVEALAAPHGVDRWLELANPLWSVREPRAEVTGVRRETADSVTLTLRPNGVWRGFTAGQHARFGVEVDGVRRTRCFSIASSQHRADGRVEIIAKAGPRSTVARHLREHARPGDVLTMSQAAGEFTVPARRPERIVLLSAGSGITPVLSMLRTLADEGHRGRVSFTHYAREPIARADLAAMRDAYDVRVRDPRDGRFDVGHLPSWAADAPTWLCGPPVFMDAVRATHPEPDRLRVERFTLARHEPAAGDATGHVRFAASGRAATNSGEPILVQAERAGLTPPHGCRMGVCLTCTSHVEHGRVRDLRTGAVTTVDGDDGADVQVCVSVPVGDVAVRL